MMKYKILSTKKLESSLIDRVKQNDMEIIEQEFISIQPVFSQEKIKQLTELINSGVQHFVFTSANAAIVLKPVLQNNKLTNNCKIFCLAGKTKETIVDSGFPEKNILIIADNASTLAKKIVEEKIKEVIFFCGNQRRDELPEILKNDGIKVHEVIVYETIETPATIMDEFDAILFFSPSAVKSFFSVNQLRKNTICFAIGQTTADCIADFTDNRIITSEFPSQEMMITSVQNYFQNINCYE
ncbi:MAG TPA: uroporphyrinogen-III synthase [Chitinophagaceae bacterium]|nr:uroporphyrinogen-III synthase [Chitinophagaceae bacterium]